MMKRSIEIPFVFLTTLILVSTTFETVAGQGESCSVCGESLEVTNPEAIFEFPGQPAVPCGILEAAGEGGLIPTANCNILPNMISDICACKSSDSAPVAPPITTSSPTLNPNPTQGPTYSPVDPCQKIPPSTSRCELEELRLLQMRFLGGNCAESSNQQASPNQFRCEDYGALLTQDEIYLEVKDTAGVINYYSDTIEKYQIADVGDTFIMNSNMNITFYKISNSSGAAVTDDIIQTMQLSSDCDDGTKLFLGDVYGGLQLVGFGDQEKTIHCDPDDTPAPTFSSTTRSPIMMPTSVKPSFSPIRLPQDADDDDDNDDCLSKATNVGKGCGKKEQRSKKEDKLKEALHKGAYSKKSFKKQGKKEGKKGDKEEKVSNEGDDDDDDNHSRITLSPTRSPQDNDGDGDNSKPTFSPTINLRNGDDDDDDCSNDPLDAKKGCKKQGKKSERQT